MKKLGSGDWEEAKALLLQKSSNLAYRYGHLPVMTGHGKILSETPRIGWKSTQGHEETLLKEANPLQNYRGIELAIQN